MNDKEIRILAIESSCDETAAGGRGKRQTSLEQCYFHTDTDSYFIWWRRAGDRSQKTY